MNKKNTASGAPDMLQILITFAHGQAMLAMGLHERGEPCIGPGDYMGGCVAQHEAYRALCAIVRF